jgi:hypothetical protein
MTINSATWAALATRTPVLPLTRDITAPPAANPTGFDEPVTDVVVAVGVA